MDNNISVKIVSWLKEQVEKSGARGLVFGLSGGIDSACVGVLCQKAVKDNCLGLIMPCESHSNDEDMAFLIANKYSIPVKKISLDEPFEKLLDVLPASENNIARANLKPRLRMLTLYYHAANYGYLVCGCGNKTEIELGYYTKYGDGAADVLPLGNLLKTQVRQLAKDLGIPPEVIARRPSAGLWPDQFDEDEMGLLYDEADNILRAIESNNTKDIDRRKLNKVMSMISSSQHKRDPIPTP
ncbi:MAG: NAD(+) synthase [bacterium]|nr:NAD(+) synthase [bacterium]